MPARRIAAAWLCPMGRPPIRRGAILIDASGRIAEVGPEDAVSRPAQVPQHDFPSAVVLPGLINTHTHLELTGFEAAVPEADFPGWIRHLIALKAARQPDAVLESARQGIRNGWAQGITTVADTGDSGAPLKAMVELEASGIAYQEVFGPHPDLARQQLAEFQGRFAALRQLARGRVVIGVSPHAPYSVSGPLYRLVAEWAEEERLPVAVHVAESLEESALVTGDSGPFAAQWRTRGIPKLESGGATPIEWLERQGMLSDRTLCIHAVRAGPADVARIARHAAAVAHCPRSNRRHAGLMAPVQEYLGAGVRVGIGTDSVASVSPLDLMAEARLAQSQSGLSAETAASLITSRAAEAIGLGRQIGVLEPGRWGDVVVIQVPQPPSAETLFQAVLDSRPADVQSTVLGGRIVHQQAGA